MAATKRPASTHIDDLIFIETKKQKIDSQPDDIRTDKYSLKRALKTMSRVRMNMQDENDCCHVHMLLESFFHYTPNGRLYQYCKFTDILGIVCFRHTRYLYT